MTKIDEKGEYVLVRMSPGEKFPGHIGAHCDDMDYAMRILESCGAGTGKTWTWSELKYYGWTPGTLAVITKHDFLKLHGPEENEFGQVSP